MLTYVYIYIRYIHFIPLSTALALDFCKKHHEHEPFGIALIQFSQWQKIHFGLTGILKCHQRMYFKKEIGLNIWLTKVLILRCSLLCWYSVSAPLREKSFLFGRTWSPASTCSMWLRLMVFAPRCLNIRKEILLLLPQVKMSFLLQLYKTNKRVTALDEQKNNGYWDLLKESVEYALSQKWIAQPWLPTDIE